MALSIHSATPPLPTRAQSDQFSFGRHTQQLSGSKAALSAVGEEVGGGGRVEYRKQTAAYKTWSHSQRERDMNVYGGDLRGGGVGGAPPAYRLMLSSGEL